MNAREALDAAKCAGVSVSVDGGDLVLEATGEVPAGIIASLKRHKADALSLLRPSRARNIVDLECERWRRRVADKEAELAKLGLGADGVTPLAGYRRLEAEGAAEWEGK